MKITPKNNYLPIQSDNSIPKLRYSYIKTNNKYHLHLKQVSPSQKIKTAIDYFFSTLHYSFTSAFTTKGGFHSSTSVKKVFSSKKNIPPLNSFNPSELNGARTIYVPIYAPGANTNSLQPQTWFFSFELRQLRNSTTQIPLTSIESQLIKTLILSTERICSKQDLILGISKNPHTYSGLEMSLSRLQNKFRDAFNERLFRSVRNRGYCLVQDVKTIS